MTESVVVVTGGGRGIGRAICRRFAAEGAQTIAASRSATELEETRRLIVEANGRCHVEPTDVSNPEDLRLLIENSAKRFGRIDVLVNCAGVAPRCTMEDLDRAMFETILAVNVTAVYYGCRAVWPIMKKQKEGVIINISSVASVDPFTGFAAYGAAKAWVNVWTKALADEGRAFGIRVFAVAPGAVETRMLRSTFPDFPTDQTLQPQDVADVVYAIAQPECRYVSGQTVFVKK